MVGESGHPISRRTVLFLGAGLCASVLIGCRSSSPDGVDGPSDGGVTGVDLAYADNKTVTGKALGHTAHLTVALPQSPGTAKGSFSGDPVNLDWDIEYNGSATQTLFPATLQGTVARETIQLSGQFQHAASFLFQSGSVSGSAGGSTVQAQLTSAPGETTSSVNADGSFGGVAFSLYGTLNGDLTSGYIEGTVADKPFRLNADVKSKVVHVTGTYTGTPALLALMVGSLLYFLPGGIFS